MTHDINNYTDLIIRRISALLNGTPYPPFIPQDVGPQTSEARAETSQALTQCGHEDFKSNGSLTEGHAIN